MGAAADYEPRYLAGICHFNDGAYFEAHAGWDVVLVAESYILCDY